MPDSRRHLSRADRADEPSHGRRVHACFQRASTRMRAHTLVRSRHCACTSSSSGPRRTVSCRVPACDCEEARPRPIRCGLPLLLRRFHRPAITIPNLLSTLRAQFKGWTSRTTQGMFRALVDAPTADCARCRGASLLAFQQSCARRPPPMILTLWTLALQMNAGL
jgi:hypothetical protein